MRRLAAQPTTVEELFADVDFGARAPADRPYLVINMVASVDGRATLHGRTADLSSPADKQVFFALRRRVDAVLVGTGTLREERYGPLLRDEEEQPLAIVCSRRGDFPDDIPLFTDPRSRVLTHTGPSPREALVRAHAEHGVRSVLCEGGPTLNGVLFAEGVVDELFLSISPLIANSPAPLTIVEAAGPGAPVRLEPVWVLEADGMLFCRYAVARAG
ncbi:MAG TPA: dihydrofolate reductase family protein [Solirubrobacteraceae bacterium]|nr:dihydrofolate reductase family protein [Solirubrobacteraceae bacterium]